uniref:Uncharacterized protein n=1 Tax=Papio anubis TaxID=9555 RepID=A0A8I5NFI1_PAPAN
MLWGILPGRPSGDLPPLICISCTCDYLVIYTGALHTQSTYAPRGLRINSGEEKKHWQEEQWTQAPGLRAKAGKFRSSACLLPAGAQFPARPPDRARLYRAGLAVRLCGRQMMPETTAPRAVPRQGGARRARESETCPRSSSARDLPLPPAASCPRHDPAGAPALRARRAGPGLSRAGRGLRHWPLPGKAVPPMARPARAVPSSPRGQPAVAVSSEPLHAGAPGAAKPEAADPGAAAGGFHDDLRAGPALGQPGAAHPGQEGAGPGHLHGLLCPGPGPGAARRRARGDLRGGSAAPGAGAAPVEAGRGGAQDRPPAEARPADPGRTAGGGRGRHLRRGRGGCGQGELRCLLRALPAAAATRRHPRRPQSPVAREGATTSERGRGGRVCAKPKRTHPAGRQGLHQPPAPGRWPHLGLQDLGLAPSERGRVAWEPQELTLSFKFENKVGLGHTTS